MSKKKQRKTAEIDDIRGFDRAPNSMLIDIPCATLVARRSRASIYRHIDAGELELVKVGCSSRIRIGDLRRLIKAKGGAA